MFATVIGLALALITSSSSSEPLRTPLTLEPQQAEVDPYDPQRDWIEDYIIERMQTNHIPGLTACIVVGDEIVWTFAYGYQRIEPEIMATDSTLFMMASISKTFTGTAVLQLWEDGLIDLYGPVNDYLVDLQVANPFYPSPDISVWNTETHTSSIRDNWNVMSALYTFGGDSPIPLGEFMYDYYDPDGRFYSEGNNFYNYPPGAYYNYSNMAYALQGYLVEEVTGTSFDQYCNENIFWPMGMDETSWFLADLDTNHVAMPYQWLGDEWVAYGYFGYPDYPAGQLRTSSLQLARLLIAFLNEGWVNGYQVLDAATVAEATTPQCPSLNPNIGLTWYRMFPGGRTVWGHGGGDIGVRTLFGFCPAEGTGVVVLTNGEAGLGAIFAALFDYATELLGLEEGGGPTAQACAVSVSPNPAVACAVITIELPSEGVVEVSVYDLFGHRVLTPLGETFLQPGVYELELDASELPAGSYFVFLRSGTEEAVDRIIRLP